jgi:EF-P beta-lysylation protein EpmB
MMRKQAACDTLRAMTGWQQELRDLIRDHGDLLAAAGLSDQQIPPLAQDTLAGFPVRAPAAWLQRIQANSPDDPLLRQVLPVPEEAEAAPGYHTDPVGELRQAPAPGLIRKYQGRALLITTSVCAIHCRYCFRRHYPYADNNPGRANWTAALEVIRSDPGIREVILSGGDPLTLSDAKLASLIRRLEEIPHLAWLRIHTRMPVVMPSRVTDGLIASIMDNRFKAVMVIHANHPDEIDGQVGAALTRLHGAGLQLLNQSVLLAGINDNADVLARLSERLHASHVLPYYLHMLDPVAGAAHFAVSDAAAVAITEELRTRLPGYLVPRLVREQAGAPFKIPLA